MINEAIVPANPPGNTIIVYNCIVELIDTKSKLSAKKIFGSRVALHVYFWIVVVVFTGFAAGFPDQILMAMLRTVTILPADMLLVYTVLYLLIPRLLLKKKYFLFVVITLALSILDELANRFLIFNVFFPKTKPGELALSMKEIFNFLLYFYHLWAAIAIKLFRVWNKENKEALASEKARHETELKLKEAEVKLLQYPE